MSGWTPKSNRNNRNNKKRDNQLSRSYNRNNNDSSTNHRIYQNNVSNAYNSPNTCGGGSTYPQSTLSQPNNNNNNDDNNASHSYPDKTHLKIAIAALEHRQIRIVYRICKCLTEGNVSSMDSRDPRNIKAENNVITPLVPVLCAIGFTVIRGDGAGTLNYAHRRMDIPAFVVDLIEKMQKDIDDRNKAMQTKKLKSNKMSQSSGSSSSSFDLDSDEYGSHGHAAMANRFKKSRLQLPDHNKNRNKAKKDENDTDYSGYSSKEAKESKATRIREAVKHGRTMDIDIFGTTYTAVSDKNKENSEAFYSVQGMGSSLLVVITHKSGQQVTRSIHKLRSCVKKIH